MDIEERGENPAPRRHSLEDPTRRQLVVGAAGGIAAFLLFRSFARGGGGGSVGGGSSDRSRSASDGPTGTPSASQTCTLYPEETEGPYYRNVDLVRRDITEGKPGVPLTLVLQVLRQTGCDPIRDVDVEIWHTDASGVYSDDGTAGPTFLRGTQTTDSNGRVTFETVYPGWYPGRTTHVHFKVHLSSRAVVTSQMYFPEEVTAAVYTTAPYSARKQKDTSNAADFVYAGSTPPLLKVRGNAAGYAGSLAITVAA